jgi:hypothetical protein
VPTLHIHIDESGTPKFTAQSPRYYVFAVAWTYEPSPLASDLSALRFKLLRDGHDIPCLHAQKDHLEHKQEVSRLLDGRSNWNWAAAVIEMAKVHPEGRSPDIFYPQFMAAPIRFVLRGRAKHATRALIYTDQLQVNKESVKKAIRMTCAAELKHRGIPYHLYHHPSPSNAWLQVADYCAYAVYRKWEFSDNRLYDSIKRNLACPEMDLLRNGLRSYYVHQSLTISN